MFLFLYVVKKVGVCGPSSRTVVQVIALHVANLTWVWYQHPIGSVKHLQEWLLSTKPAVSPEHFQEWYTNRKQMSNVNAIYCLLEEIHANCSKSVNPWMNSGPHSWILSLLSRLIPMWYYYRAPHLGRGELWQVMLHIDQEMTSLGADRDVLCIGIRL